MKALGTRLVVVLVTLGCLVPFAGKAFHIDDPLFLWSAEQIRSAPTDPYGFTVNWYGREQPASEVVKNPPGAAYLIALVTALFGTSELVLHLAFLLPAVGLMLGMFHLARRFGADPTLACLVALANPVLLISATQVMCDVTMLCFWVWAVWFWMRGLDEERGWMLWLAALLVAASALTKYFGVSLIPLLLVFGLMRRCSVGRWALSLLLPVALLAAYQMWTHSLYGRGLLLDAASYAESARQVTGRPFALKILTGLTFTGGCLSSLLFLAPRLWSRRVLIACGAALVVATLLLPLAGNVGQLVLRDASGTHWGLSFQFVLFVLLGLGWLVLGLEDWLTSRNADAAFLLMWLGGTIFFAAFLNWSVNGRSMLPMVPVAGLLVARRLASREIELRWAGALVLVPALILALVPTWADHRMAGSARRAAREIAEAHPESKTWFQGHWGFQYYMQEAGAVAVRVERIAIAPGELLVTPSNNTNLFAFPGEALGRDETFLADSPRWVSTMHSGRAGFYSDGFSPLPWAFGPVPRDRYSVRPFVLPLRPGG